MHTPLPKRYRFVDTHPKPWKGQIFVLLEVGLCMQDLVGKAFGEVWGSSTMAHTYKINAYYTWGLAGGVSKGNRPKAPKHERRKSETHQQQAFPKKPVQNHGGRTCRKAAHHNKHKPTHPPRLIIQSVLCENRNGKKRGTNTGQSNHTPCEVCIFKGNQRQLGAYTSKNIQNQMELGHTQAKTFKNKWNFAFK